MRPYEERFPWKLDWNLLRTFTVVVEQGGITRAAEFMNLSQPTISSALKRLEDTTEKRLLHRRPGHFALTPAGETLYRESCMLF
ncbi:LysR family transcriptional regulator, partial [Sinorhizobium fredii]